MKYQVHVTGAAYRDLLDLYEYVAENDAAENAERLLDQLRGSCAGLSHHPQRGHFTEELMRLGPRLCREIHLKPYRIVYRIAGREVFVIAIVDGRRDVQSLLERRLTR
jgi:toxin ParE1/3/4